MGEQMRRFINFAIETAMPKYVPFGKRHNQW